ncbi:uncharacterized protein F5Z01DRAFT_45941 [Emericellopsis atlantica]|uniref:Phospholipase/carboxylesterase/thioesterase domain-containing protein n=1 Tax=Emericellopsis atlantica TaxID=2614577 RepID=A0A9P7ZNH8_9HYPO|nr:uncharacterized protein F5Z01DRAFT_45941 [Emericellopsis atlantica]KAG9255280.1 hypothetical protein F5Z01DRAFT_45941 [Emericellopsis atlantica]
MPPRVPVPSDFDALQKTLPHTLHFPSPPESVTAILILLHGLGDTHTSFSSFAKGMNLPGFLAITVRGTTPLPAALLEGQEEGWHWGDDLTVDQRTGGIDPDPGFEAARRRIMDDLVDGLLVGQLGWERGDVLFFGYGQGGSLALGMASSLRSVSRVAEATSPLSSTPPSLGTFKGIVSIGGPLPNSMIPTLSSRGKSRTRVLAVQFDDEELDAAKREFEQIQAVNWKRREVGMPRDREEMFPIMKFYAERLNSGF